MSYYKRLNDLNNDNLPNNNYINDPHSAYRINDYSELFVEMPNMKKLRFCAFLVDFLVSSIMLLIFYFMTLATPLKNATQLATYSYIENVSVFKKVNLGFIYFGFLCNLYYFIYNVIIPIFTNGKTLGKYVFDLKITKENQLYVRMKDLLLREFIGKILSTLLFFFGFIMIWIRKDDLGLHDIIANTEIKYSPKKGRNCK
ncbi:MAG: RDD family protein [bacterium]